ncbi:MAG TPA: Xaa-Pro peptidase family protein [Gemmatimonadota bacterium]|nr:Xaa-Pro peptidase family protein [Gemmatimonadota bacterium]
MSGPERRERAREEIVRRGWHGALVTPGVNFEYLTGAAVDRSERLTCIGLAAAGDPWIVCPAFEAERLGAAYPGAELVLWEETEDPFAAVARKIGGAGTWAFEPTTWYHDAARIESAARGARFVDGGDAFETLRRAKDASEIAALRRAIDAAWEVHDAVVPRLAVGVTEKDVERWIADEFAARGYEAWSLVQFGPGSAIPHGHPSDRALERGQAVLLDWGGWGEGVSADLTRTTWWDEEPIPLADAPPEFRKVGEVVQSAQRAALELAAPGVPCGDVDEAARRVIRDAGWAPRFTHRLGHGLGHEIHEPPYLVAGSRVPLAPGDVVTVEPGVYLPGEFGFRWEDDVLVTADGIDVLSRR